MVTGEIPIIRNDKLISFIAKSIVRKVLSSFGSKRRIEYRRLRWLVCSRTSLTKWEANQVLRYLMKEGFIETSKPQSNSERTAWLTQKGSYFLRQQSLN
jgi:transcription initiation factor IIE alpha subunit